MSAPHPVNVYKYVVLTCLSAHVNIGYNVPTFSSIRLQALDESITAGLEMAAASPRFLNTIPMTW